jgi:hypothetical protein
MPMEQRDTCRREYHREKRRCVCAAAPTVAPGGLTRAQRSATVGAGTGRLVLAMRGSVEARHRASARSREQQIVRLSAGSIRIRASAAHVAARRAAAACDRSRSGWSGAWGGRRDAHRGASSVAPAPIRRTFGLRARSLRCCRAERRVHRNVDVPCKHVVARRDCSFRARSVGTWLLHALPSWHVLGRCSRRSSTCCRSRSPRKCWLVRCNADRTEADTRSAQNVTPRPTPETLKLQHRGEQGCKTCEAAFLAQEELGRRQFRCPASVREYRNVRRLRTPQELLPEDGQTPLRGTEGRCAVRPSEMHGS